MKEAAYKALYPKWKPTWKELSYFSADPLTHRKPGLRFHSIAEKDKLGLHVSVSHDGDNVVTMVLAESMESAS